MVAARDEGVGPPSKARGSFAALRRLGLACGLIEDALGAAPNVSHGRAPGGTLGSERLAQLKKGKVVREIADHLRDIGLAVSGDAARMTSRDECLGPAVELANRMPLVHRTGRVGQPQPWPEILQRRALLRLTDLSEEERRCGFERAVYLFLGSAAYPKGSVVLILERAAIASLPGTFSPFDSGALSHGHLAPEPAEGWDIDDRTRRLDHHSANTANLVEFAGPFVAAHFREAASYVRRPQQSDADFAPYHGLHSTTGDRRAWTIEIRVHRDLPVLPAASALRAIVLADRSLEADVPDEFLRFVAIAEPIDDGAGDVVMTTLQLVLDGARLS